jgi:hypothetical protein
MASRILLDRLALADGLQQRWHGFFDSIGELR